MKSRLLVRRQKMHGSQRCCGKLAELTVDDIWQIAVTTMDCHSKLVLSLRNNQPNAGHRPSAETDHAHASSAKGTLSDCHKVFRKPLLGPSSANVETSFRRHQFWGIAQWSPINATIKILTIWQWRRQGAVGAIAPRRTG